MDWNRVRSAGGSPRGQLQRAPRRRPHLGGSHPHRPRPVRGRPIRLRVRGESDRRAIRRLIDPGGESDNPDWDGIWEAATARLPTGWSAEIRIPVLTLAFKPGLHEWQFNVQRRIQRRLETDRWASPNRQYQITQTSRAGLLTGLPDFDLGVGLTIRPAVTSGGGIPAPMRGVEGDFQPSLDINQRIGANVLASATVNTDFAETEVDTRRTNLTRFPLFFPEKRTFFIEGDDIFSFGLGLARTCIPYFSRRIGLIDGVEVPIMPAAK